jgi:hypothetical protein
MIERLTKRNIIDVYEFVQRIKDRFQDFYVTQSNQRLFLTDLNLIRKIIERQEVFGLYEKGFKGLLIVYKEKGFRPYIKILSENRKSESSLLRYLMLNYSEQDLYIKLKQENPLARFLQYINPHTKKTQYGFMQVGPRGQEVLLFRKGIKILYKMQPKDLLLTDEENRLY